MEDAVVALAHMCWGRPCGEAGQPKAPAENDSPPPYDPGHWDKTGVIQFPEPGWQDSPEPKWVQNQHSMVVDALQEWVGSSDDLRRHVGYAQAGEWPEHSLSSGNGKRWAAQAKALVHEIRTKGKANPMQLYRGAHQSPIAGQVTSWSENRKTANRFANLHKKTGATSLAGTVLVAPKGTVRGIRMQDYIRSGLDEHERQWLVLS